MGHRAVGIVEDLAEAVGVDGALRIRLLARSEIQRNVEHPETRRIAATGVVVVHDAGAHLRRGRLTKRAPPREPLGKTVAGPAREALAKIFVQPERPIGIVAVARAEAGEQLQPGPRPVAEGELRGEGGFLPLARAAEQVERHRRIVDRERSNTERERGLGCALVEPQRAGGLRERDVRSLEDRGLEFGRG